MKKTMSAGGVVINQNGDVAIVNQKHKSWSLPKGHVEENEDILEAARREVNEETGLSDLTLIKPLGIYERYAMDHENNDNKQELKTLHFFLFETREETLSPMDVDNPEAIWVKKEQVEDYLTHPEDKKFFRQVLTELIHDKDSLAE